MKKNELIKIIKEELIKVLLEGDSMNKKLYLTIGISGCGKSTYLNKNFDKKIIVCPDNIRKEITGSISDQSKDFEVWNIVRERLHRNLENYGEALLDATNVTSKYRGDLLSDFPDVQKIALLFKSDPEVSKNRIKKDIESGVDRSDVPDDVIDRQYQNFIDGHSDIKLQFDKIINVS